MSSIKFNLEDLNPFIRFYFDEDKPEDGWVELRQMSPDEQRRVNAATVKVKTEYKKGSRFQFVDSDPKWANKADNMTWDYCIGEFLIFDQNNQEIPVTKENKLKLMGRSAFFINFVSKKISELANTSPVPTEEEEEKN